MTSRLLPCLPGTAASCAYTRTLASRNTLPGIQILTRPAPALRVSWIGVHQPEHLAHSRFTVGQYGLHQEFPDECIQRRLMTLGVGAAGFECLFVQGERDVLHAHIVNGH